MSKECTKCKANKEFSLFRKNKKMKSGFDSWCLSCVSEHKAMKRQEVKLLPKPQTAIKKCFGCKTEKSADDFCIERGNIDGLSRICRKCRSEKHYTAYAKDPDAYKQRCMASHNRRKSIPSVIVHKRVSARVREWLGTKRGGKRTFELLGYSLPELKDHLERQFQKGMGWSNAGEWHIDHIVPLSSFDETQVRQAWALPNLRPLWAAENIKKKDSREFLL